MLAQKGEERKAEMFLYLLSINLLALIAFIPYQLNRRGKWKDLQHSLREQEEFPKTHSVEFSVPTDMEHKGGKNCLRLPVARWIEKEGKKIPVIPLKEGLEVQLNNFQNHLRHNPEIRETLGLRLKTA